MDGCLSACLAKWQDREIWRLVSLCSNDTYVVSVYVHSDAFFSLLRSRRTRLVRTIAICTLSFTLGYGVPT